MIATLTGILLCSLAGLPPAAKALGAWSDQGGRPRLTLRGSFKWTSVLSHAPDDSLLFPKRWSAAGLWRARLNLDVRPVSWMQAEVAYEQRARSASAGSGAGSGAGILPPELEAPYRLRQLDRALVEIGSSFAYRHELDRALISLRAGQAEAILGRQAVGWGRGLLFSAVDIFAPFTPLESDREWRRGIDAVRVRQPLMNRSAVEVVAALGDSLDASAFMGRMQGRFGDVDGELIVGWRRKDTVYALTASAPVRGAELHGEYALFHTPAEVSWGAGLGRADLIPKAVLGGSYNLGIPGGLMMMGEYHYSGFGLSQIEELETRAAEEDFRTRVAQGDTQILGRHAGALQLTYGFAGVAPVSLTWLFSPTDGSGVLISTVSWLFSDQVTLNASGYFPYGEPPIEGVLQSEYGGTPVSGLVQVGVYF